MSILADFDRLNLTTKSIGLSLVGLLPFWLVSIYLFKRPLYDHGDYIIIGAFCLCFTVIYYVLNVMNILLANETFEDNDKDLGDILFAILGVVSVVNLCTWMVLAYTFDWTFKTLLICIFSVPIGLFIIIVVANSSKKKGSQ